MAQNNIDLMNKAKEHFKEEVTSITYDTWFKPLEIVDISNEQITITTADSFTQDFLNSRYKNLIYHTFKFLTNIDRDINIIPLNEINKQKENQNSTNSLELSMENTYSYRSTNLNPLYTFDTFIIGDNNSFASAAAQGVVDAPGKVYNPLFIYGGVGLRKNALNACYRK